MLDAFGDFLGQSPFLVRLALSIAMNASGRPVPEFPRSAVPNDAAIRDAT